jgi:hypothetical protein
LIGIKQLGRFINENSCNNIVNLRCARVANIRKKFS